MTPSHVKACVAGLSAVDTALRDPTEDDIPRDKRGSFVQRLGSVTGLIHELGRHVSRYDNYAISMLETIAEKLDGIASDMALADGKGGMIDGMSVAIRDMGRAEMEEDLKSLSADDIPRDRHGLFVEQLGSACEMAQIVHEALIRDGSTATATYMRTIIETVERVARDMALAESKGESESGH